MAAFLYDTLLADPQAGIATHSPETGGSWVAQSSQWGSVNNNVFVYPAGYARSTNTSGFSIAYNTVTPPSPDVLITLLLGKTTTASSSESHIVFRGDTGSDSCYRVVVTLQRAQIYRTVGGSHTLLVQGDVGTGIDVADTLFTYEILCKGDQITVSRNGVIVATASDSTITAAGLIGFGNRSTSYVAEISAEDGAGGPTPTTGTADGVATVTGLSIATRATTGTITAGAAGSFISQTFRTGYGQSIGQATVNGIGIAISFAEGTGAIAAGATVTGVGRSIRAGVGIINASSTSEWTAAGLSVGESEGTIAAGATVNGVGERVFNTLGTSSGQTSSAMVGRSIAETTGLIEGVAEVLGVGAAFDLGMTDGTVSAGATVNGVGGTIINTVGTIAGNATVTGKVVSGSVSRINGRATVTGRSLQIRSTTGTAAGSTDSNMIGSQFEGSQGVSRGSSEVMGVGHAIVATVGEITGTSDSYFLSFGVTAFITPADRTIEIPTEDRAIIVLGEDRAIIVPRSDTSAAAELESRTIEVIAENRAIEVIAEDRSLTVNPENREIIL